MRTGRLRLTKRTLSLHQESSVEMKGSSAVGFRWAGYSSVKDMSREDTKYLNCYYFMLSI